MTDALLGFRWLEEFNYNCQFFANRTFHASLHRNLAFPDGGGRYAAVEFLRSCIEHSDELSSACRHLIEILEEDPNG